MSERIPLIRQYRGDAVLLWHRGRGVTQQTFLQRALQLSTTLPENGWTVNLCRDRYYFMLGFCATLLRGSRSLLPPNRQRETVRDIVERYPGSICLVDGEQDIGLPALDIACCPDGPEIENLAVPAIEANQMAAIAFTSGSTGTPSANAKPWGTLCGTARLLAKRFAPAADARPSIVATVPSQHMYGLEMTVMMALQGDCALESACPFFAEEVATALECLAQPRLLVTTPVHLRHIQDSSVEMPAVARVVSATAPLSAEAAGCAEARLGGVVEEIFGCTEAGSIATRRSVSEDSWLLLDGMGITQDETGTTVTGPQLAAATVLQDRMEVLAPNRFRFLGRAADMINVGGKRASLADLTSKLLQLEGVSDAVVFIPATGGVVRPAALVVSQWSEREVLQALAAFVDPVLLPRPLKKVTSIPRNETGKAPLQALLQVLNSDDG